MILVILTFQKNCYLDDPYEGELFAFLMDLYAPWTNISEREDIWIYKRAMLQSVNYTTPSGNITVQRGWWFSAHEQWKYLELPYNDIPINHRVFLNGERARTWNSALNKIPGLYASVNDVAKYPSENIPEYLSAAGIQPIAFCPILWKDVVTPYGSWATFLANFSVALVWYDTMLDGPSMQNPYGSTEAAAVNGTEISPVITWDSKITTVLGMLGGFSAITAAGLKEEGKYDRFYYIVEREWSRVFTSLSGENLPFALPTATIPHTTLGDFTNCS